MWGLHGFGYTYSGLGEYGRIEPRTVKQRLENIVTYLSAKLEKTESIFNRLKKTLTGEPDNYTGSKTIFNWDNSVIKEYGKPSYNGQADLLRLRDTCRVYKKLLKQVEKQYSQIPEVQAELKVIKERYENNILHEQQSEARKEYDRQQISKVNL